MHNTYIAKIFPEHIYTLGDISRRTIEEHLKLYQGYVSKYNEINHLLSAITPEDYTKANQTYSLIRELKLEMTFAYGGIVNHELYFGHMMPVKTEPKNDFLLQIEKDFGTMEQYIYDLKASGMAARGWVWTAWNYREQRLCNYIGDAQNTYPVWGAYPILALDVYEHAYFIDFGSSRARYIDAYIAHLDWSQISNNFSQSNTLHI